MNPVVEEELTDKKDVEAAEDEAELVLAAASPRTVTRDRPKVGMVAWMLEVARTAVKIEPTTPKSCSCMRTAIVGTF